MGFFSRAIFFFFSFFLLLLENVCFCFLLEDVSFIVEDRVAWIFIFSIAPLIDLSSRCPALRVPRTQKPCVHSMKRDTCSPLSRWLRALHDYLAVKEGKIDAIPLSRMPSGRGAATRRHSHGRAHGTVPETVLGTVPGTVSGKAGIGKTASSGERRGEAVRDGDGMQVTPIKKRVFLLSQEGFRCYYWALAWTRGCFYCPQEENVFWHVSSKRDHNNKRLSC